MAIVLTSDFTGTELALPINQVNDDTTILESVIDATEKEILTDLLGVDLYDLFVADLTGTPEVPVTQKYLDIFNAFQYDSDWGIIKSLGIKEMLKRFIYYNYLKSKAYKASQNGIVSSQLENSVNTSNEFLYSKYNEGVLNYKAIQQKIIDNSSDYPDFNGQYKGVNSSLI